MPKSKIFLLGAVLLTLAMSACSAATSTSPTTTLGTVPALAPTLPSVHPTATTPAETTPLIPAPATVATSPPTLPQPVSTSSSASSSTTDYEVVGGIFTTKTAAQSQIDKLTAATLTGFSIKDVGAKFAAVLPGLSKADATALAAKINKTGAAKATIFHVTSSSTTTPTTNVVSSSSTNYEVVAGIYTTRSAAQAQIDKLASANFSTFTIKPITGKFAVVHAGLTKVEATDLMTKIDAANLGPSRIKAL